MSCGEKLRASVSDNIPPQELYEDPDKPSLSPRPTQLPQRPGPQASRRGGYEDIDGDVPNGRKPSPPLAARREELTPPSDAVYAQVDKSRKKRPASDTTPPPLQPYGQLQHFESSKVPAQPDEYRKLDHVSRPSPPRQEEYRRLDHGATAGYQPEEYGKLDRGNKEQSPPHPFAEYGKLETTVGSPQSQPGEYGRLNNFDPYGTLCLENEQPPQQTPVIEQKPPVNIEQKPPQQTLPVNIDKKKFPGYETMDIEDPAIYSVIDDNKPAHKNRPPPGYENRVLMETPAERASFRQASPPTSRARHGGYVNVSNDGLATPTAPPTAPPVAPRRTKVNGMSSGKSELENKVDECKENQPKIKAQRTVKPKPAPKPKISPKPKVTS